MKVGIIGEKNNFISYSILRETLACQDVEVAWFVEAELPAEEREKLYEADFDYGSLIRIFEKIKSLFRKNKDGAQIDCEQLCGSKGIPYIIPKNLSINAGLPDEMYSRPEVEYDMKLFFSPMIPTFIKLIPESSHTV